jgi:hypothetical protein
VRDLSSKSLTGPEAVMTALLVWWLSRYPNIIEKALSKDIWHISLRSLREDDVGYAIWEASGFHRAEERFWQEVRQDPVSKHLVEQCVLAWRSAPGERAVTSVRKFVKNSLLRLLARQARKLGKLPHRVDRVDRASPRITDPEG